MLSANVSGLALDVKTIKVSGKVTLNGATPMLGVDCPSYPSAATASLLATESTKGYVTAMYTLCRDSTFSFSDQLYPGVYSIRVNGNTNASCRFSNLPVGPSRSQSYVGVAQILIP